MKVLDLDAILSDLGARMTVRKTAGMWCVTLFREGAMDVAVYWSPSLLGAIQMALGASYDPV